MQHANAAPVLCPVHQFDGRWLIVESQNGRVVLLVIDLNVRRNQPQCSNCALNIRTRQSHGGSCRSKGGRCRGTNGNSSYLFSAEKCTFIIKYSKAWKWCRTFSANLFDLNVRHLTCLRSFCVEHSGQLPRISKGQAIDGK